jgi:hypothetical protein
MPVARPRLRPPTPAERARVAAGFTLASAARRAQVTPEYYRRQEIRNQFAWGQAMFLARLFGCSPWTFSKLALVHDRERERSR